MSYFNLNITKMNNSIQNYQKNKVNYEKDFILLCNSLVNIDSSWNDINSQIFVKKVISDKNSILNYLQSVDSLFNQLSAFVDSLELVWSKLGYRSELKKIKFDDSQVSKIISQLNSANDCLENAFNLMDIYFRSSNFKNMQVIYDLKNEVKDSMSVVCSIIEKINDFVKMIVDKITDSINKINKINELDLNLNVFRYTGNIVDLY